MLVLIANGNRELLCYNHAMMCNNEADRTAGAWGSSSRWLQMAEEVLAGRPLCEAEGLAVLAAEDDELLELLAAAYRVRRRWHGNRVELNLLINAKSGLCGEDCGYCSQSCVSQAPIARYGLLDPEQILAGARLAAQRRAGTYCIVVSGRNPDDRELEAIAEIVPAIKARHALRICVSPGLLTPQQAARLKACGVDRINHNLNTSARFYAQICTTHGYQDRLNTLAAVRQAGLEICSGGIIGMGEAEADVVELALRLGRLQAEAVPVNFYQPIAGTPLAGTRGEGQGARGESTGDGKPGRPLDPRYCLKVLALFRLANPRCELRIAAGREMHLGSLQPLGLYVANSIFVGDYLTTQGQPPEDDFQMLADLGFETSGEGRAVRDAE
jgi:biotin synthase